MSPGMNGVEAGQNGTYPFRGCPDVPSTPDTQPAAEAGCENVPPTADTLDPSSLACTFNSGGRLITKCAAPDIERNAAGEVVGCKNCEGVA